MIENLSILVQYQTLLTITQNSGDPDSVKLQHSTVVGTIKEAHPSQLVGVPVHALRAEVVHQDVDQERDQSPWVKR